MTQTRTAVLGGELSKRSMFGARSVLDWVVLAATVVLTLMVLYGLHPGSAASLIAGAAVAAVGAGLTYPVPHYLDGYSALTIAVLWIGRKSRRFSGQDAFVPVEQRQDWVARRNAEDAENPDVSVRKARRRARARARRWGVSDTGKHGKDSNDGSKARTAGRGSSGSGKNPRVNAPSFVGRVRWFEYETTAGKMVVFKHLDRPKSRAVKTRIRYTVILEVTGVPGGIMREDEANEAYKGHGQLLARLASSQSLACAHQQIARSLPVDMTDHISWAQAQVAAGAPDVVIESYEQLANRIGAAAEQHRSFYILTIPRTGKFAQRAQRFGGGDAGDGRLIFDEVRKAAHWARSFGDVASVAALDESRAAALIRSLQDPDYDIDDTLSHVPGREAELLSLTDAWQLLEWPEGAGATKVNDSWFHRTGFVPPEAYLTQEETVRVLKPLVTSEAEDRAGGAFVRTVSVLTNLRDARVARKQAIKDLADDTAKNNRLHKQGKIADGSDSVKLVASKRRMTDLLPASRHHGAYYGMFFTVSAKSAQGLEDAAQAMESRAAAAGLDRIDWLDDEQDTAFATTLPLGRGLAE
jgi:hypothetical protein